MRVSPLSGTVFLALLISAVMIVAVAPGQDQQPATPVAADRFVVPDGTPAELLKFIEKIADPAEPYSTREEIRQVADAIAAAADKMIADKAATDFQLREAVEWRIGALGTLAQLGDREAAGQIDQVLDRLKDDPRPAVAQNAQHLRLTRLVPRWSRLDAAQKQATVDDLVKLFQSVSLEPRHIGLLYYLGDMLADSEDRDIIAPAFDTLLPMVKNADDPMVVRQAPRLEGISRRLNLIGSKLELEGPLLDGGMLDWESYRGKVVLVDFWATWCMPCRAEVPNVLEHYQMYKDKGFEVVGISLDETREEAESYLQQTGITWPTVFSDDPQATGWRAPMAEKYEINAIPRAILVDQKGNVVHMNARGPELGEQLAKLLGEPAVKRPAETAAEVSAEDDNAVEE